MNMSCHVSVVRVTTISLSLIEEVITMSEADVLAKYRWYKQEMMQSETNSPAHRTWVQIVRETYAAIQEMTTAATVVIQEQR